MTGEGFGAKPAVLRCSRCGRFVDWEEARLQVICGCRGQLNLPPVFVREADERDRSATHELFQSDFGHTSIVAFGEVISLDGAPALVAEMKGELAGALAYRLLPDAIHIIALATHPMWQRSGVGGYLVAEAELLGRRHNLPRSVFATTNDNLPALYFYQRRGYHITELVPEGYVTSTGSSAVPGFGGIPVRDEVRFAKDF